MKSLSAIFVFILLEIVVFNSRADTFIQVNVGHGVSMEIPRNWVVLSENRTITLDAWIEAVTWSNRTEQPS